ncbi:MAG: prepilin-type N-terminal cleavage/methylation domain-containing protein [Actinobacteria bacterium]|nr:prepilin-type N-terminal cleavage/methylation domain-containing protein [Actinomycetota bacterium]
MRAPRYFRVQLRSRTTDESGSTLVELMVAFLILSIIVSMGMTMMISVTNNTLAAAHQGVSSETVQVAAQEVGMYVSSAVTPAGAAAASGGSSLPCNAPSAITPAVTAANAYSMTYCGYPTVNGVTTARQYTITIPSSTCRQSPLPSSTTNGASGGYCTLEVINDSASPPAAVYEQPNVWCSYTCQTDGTPTSSSTPALFTYYAGPSSGPALTTPVGSLGSIQVITLDLTVLSNVNPNLPLGANGTPGTTITRQIFLSNLS